MYYWYCYYYCHSILFILYFNSKYTTPPALLNTPSCLNEVLSSVQFRHLFLVTKMHEKVRKQFGPVNLTCHESLDKLAFKLALSSAVLV